MKNLLLLFAFQCILLTGLFSQNYYTVKFPDDIVIHGCGAHADTIWPTIDKYGNCNFNVGVSVKDQVFYLNNTHTCLKILRTWKLLYWCDYNPNWSPYPIDNPTNTDIGVTVVGNAMNHGYIQYTQIIKVLDNLPPVFLNCPADGLVFCDYTGNDPAQYHNGPTDLCEGPVDLHVKVTDACSKSDIMMTYLLFLDLDGNGTMETQISSSDPTAWPIDLTTDHDTVTAKIKFPTGFGLPYGTHKVEWIANDNCGNQTTCKYSFIVKDCKAPTVVCINGLSVNIMQTGMITLWDTDFLKYTYDNCTPTNQIKIGIRKAGTGSGFPYDSHSVTFTCAELGTQNVEIWAIDAYGNADYCQTYVIVQDHNGACPSFTSLKGAVATDQTLPVPGVALKMQNGAGTIWNTASDADGNYVFIGSYSPGTYTVTPVLDTFVKTGVSTLDVLLTAAHIGNILPLQGPFHIIAADVNHDQQINNDDLTGMVQVITGQASKFPANTAWRFIPSSYVFPDPAAPLSSDIPDKITFSGVGSVTNQNFIAVKTGDVNGSAVPVSLTTTSDRKPQKQVDFTVQDQSFNAGEIVMVNLMTPNMAVMSGFQFTLGYDLTMLQLVNVGPGIVPLSQIGQFPDKGLITASWYSAVVLAGASWGEQQLLTCTLAFKALQSGSLHQALNMNSSVTNAEAYNNILETMQADLQFEQGPGLPKATLDPVVPNPAIDHISVGYYLPEDGDVVLRLVDGSGGLIAQQSLRGVKGHNQTVVDLGSVRGTRIVFLRMESAFGGGVQPVMVER